MSKYVANVTLFERSKRYIQSVDCNYTPFVQNNMAGVFVNSCLLKWVNHINQNVTNLSNTFYNCQNLAIVEDLPDNVNNMYQSFYNDYTLYYIPKIPNTVTNLAYAFIIVKH